jgi:hypothetical protein
MSRLFANICDQGKFLSDDNKNKIILSDFLGKQDGRAQTTAFTPEFGRTSLGFCKKP